MKKLALINPGENPGHAISEPLNIGFLASYLEKHGVEVKILDQLAGDNIEDELEKFNPSVIGITATTAVANSAYKIATLLKKFGATVVLGGVHPTVMPEEALNYADIVVCGEGERVLLDIVKGEIKKGIVKVNDIIKDLDSIPSPARHLMNMEFYLYTKDRLPGTHLYFVPPKTRCASILTIRGCPHSCIFCHNSWKGLPVRFDSPQRVIEEIISLIENYKIEALFFMDDNLFASKRRLREICQLIKTNKIKLMWGCQARTDTIDEKTIFMIKDAGCQQIIFGFESGSQEILGILKNNTTTVEQNKTAIRISKKAGLIVLGTFMVGSPTETIDDVKKTVEFIKETDIDKVGLFVTTPYPGTKLWESCKEKGLIPEGLNWNDFTTGNVTIPPPDGMSIDEFKKVYDWACNEIFVRKTLKDVVKIYLKPAYFYKAIKNPEKILPFIKRIRLY